MKSIRMVWNSVPQDGRIRAAHADIVEGAAFEKAMEHTVVFDRESVWYGANSTLVNVICELPFSFLLRDVRAERPIYIPDKNVIVTESGDDRTYDEIVSAIKASNRVTRLEQMNREEEFSFERAAAECRDLPGPAWLGITRDMRFFEVGLRSKSCGNDEETYDYACPKFFSAREFSEGEYSPLLKIPEMNDQETIKFRMMTGRGIGCKHEVTRRLEDGYLPILNACNEDEGIHYTMQYFVTQERSPLRQECIRGTEMIVAHMLADGHQFDEKHRKHAIELRDAELKREEETVLYVRVTAENMTDAPAYCFVMGPEPLPDVLWLRTPLMHNQYDGETGFYASSKTGNVLCVCTLEGKPMPQLEMSAMLEPGQKLTFEFKIPHRPISKDRAEALRDCDYDERLEEAKLFWRNELSSAAEICLPEKRVEEMIKAGILHMDIGYFGRNPDGALIPIIGVYTGIGSESAPGIQFLDSVGMNEMAARAFRFFVELQHDDGYVQNYADYMLETGCALWTAGEHYRMTRDEEWAKSVHEFVVKGCNYLIDWRKKNLRDELKGGNGYGMISGRTSDPPDYFHSYMLNGSSYAGLERSVDILKAVRDEENAERVAQAAAEWKESILESYRIKLTQAPVLPAADGTWYAATAPWTEYNGPLAIYSEGGKCFTHGAFTSKDQEGAIYLALYDVIDPEEPLCDDIIKFYTEFLMLNNTGFSQYYYTPHPYAHALRGEVKPFLKEFYSTMSAGADRETYNFWEHPFHASPFKLHEETWYLMRCRWMLCLEAYSKRELRLLSMVPRRWMQNGRIIHIRGMKSYFGEVNLDVVSEVDQGRIHVSVEAGGAEFPPIETLKVRLPHPEEGKKAVKATAGDYDPDTETVVITRFGGKAEFDLLF